MPLEDLKIFRTGDVIRLYSETPEPYQLEPGHVYSVEYDRFTGPFLKEQHPFADPQNFLYTDAKFHSHILKSFRGNAFNCGVLLTGQKGQGKSVSAKKLSNESSLPIITINKVGDFDLIAFLNSIPCEYVLLIDEFEKIFPIDVNDPNSVGAQGIFLSFLDGTNVPKYKKLVVLTSNNQISTFFMNRPGRIRFKKEYKFIDSSFYHAIINGTLKYPEHRDDLIRHLSPRDATVDLVRAIVEEINLLNQPYSTFKEWFNFTPSKFSYSVYIYEENSADSYPWRFKEVFDLDYQLGIQGSSGEYDEGDCSRFPGIYRYGKFVRQDEKGIYISMSRQYVDSELITKRQAINNKITKLQRTLKKKDSDDNSVDDTNDTEIVEIVEGNINPYEGIPTELKKELDEKANESIIVRFSESSYSQSAYNMENKFKS